MTTNVASILRDTAARLPQQRAIVLGDRTIDYGSLDDFSRRFAAGLRRLGVERGEHVAVLLPNVPQFSVAYFGCHYAGVPVVPMNVLLSQDEIAHQLTDSDAVALVVWEDLLSKAQAALARASACRHVVVVRADLGDLTAPPDSHNMTALVLESEPVDDMVPTSPDDTAVILYTSGTTGRPKGAELTHGNVVSNARACSTSVFPLGPDTVALVALPLFHAFGQTVMHNAVLDAGGTLVLMPRWNPASAVELIRRHEVTFFGAVPTMYVGLANHADADRDDVRSLRICVSGGAPMPVDLMAAFERRCGVEIVEGYGLSEASPVVCFNHPGKARPGSVGFPIAGVELRLVDETGDVIDRPDAVGEIWVRGPNVMKGYYNNAEATSEVLSDGWLRTGDVGVRDSDGRYRIVDRKKDMIIRGGYNVYPREIEDVLQAHPAVAEAAVVGVADPHLGEDVVAFVALGPGESATERELVAFCKERLAAYKYPRHVRILDALPHGPTGKVRKAELRAAVASGSQEVPAVA